MLYPWDESRINLDEVHDDWVERYTNDLQTVPEEKSFKYGDKEILQIKTKPPYAVYTNSQYGKHITNENFYLVDDEDKADIIYLDTHYKNMK